LRSLQGKGKVQKKKAVVFWEVCESKNIQKI
jgi:hypothetical protein